MKSRLRLATAGLVLALGLAGCSSATDSEPATTTTSAASGPVIEVAGMAYTPASITVSAGDTVTWIFDDAGIAHDVTGLGDAKGLLRSPLTKTGTYTFTFTEPGTYDYTCSLHPDMRGTVVVQPA